jgi:hypothetical protein
MYSWRVLLAFLAFGALPLSVWAATSTNFEIDPDADLQGSGHTSASASYEIDGSLGSLSGFISGNSILESGSVGGGYCGDGFVDPAEECDGGALDGGTCASEGFDDGTLQCDDDCTYNTDECENDSGGGGGGGGGSVASGSTPTVDSTLQAWINTYGSIISYDSTVTLYGSRSSSATIYIDGSSDGVSYPSTTTWRGTTSLSQGIQTIYLASEIAGGRTSSIGIPVFYRWIGDVNGDNTVDDYDLSRFVNDWNTSLPESDFNEDTTVDDYDLSLFVSNWGI